ncbi:response regulator [Ramlibacter rhizophilus]|uniref:response regulator n=1 Tax=Ramlibacter rhizophilus TaxID=1781167 RepID=UPI0019801292|nr:response regulator [Ramlibacter rhizophilus]
MDNELTADPPPLPAQAGAAFAAEPAVRGTQLLVLVVERDPHVRQLEAYFLQQAGFQVAFAADGRDALAQAREQLPDVLITEVLVPKLDGLALCRQLKQDERTKQVAVLVFSILAASSRAAEAGADAFLMKPLAEQRLITTVQSLIEANRRKATSP